MKNRDYGPIIKRLEKIVRETSALRRVKTGYGSVLVQLLPSDRSDRDIIRHHLAKNLLHFAYTLWWDEY